MVAAITSSETPRSPATEVTPFSRRQVPKPSSPSTWLSAILALHIALGIWYSFVNPLFEAGDERWHYPYVKALADGHGLAVQPENPVVYNWRQQGSQPPLYYLLAAGLTAWIDTGPPRSVVPENPHAIVGQPHASGNKNMALARPAPQGPEWGVVLAAHLIRVATVLIGAVTVWATYLYVRQILPVASPWLALVAAP